MIDKESNNNQRQIPQDDLILRYCFDKLYYSPFHHCIERIRINEKSRVFRLNVDMASK